MGEVFLQGLVLHKCYTCPIQVLHKCCSSAIQVLYECYTSAAHQLSNSSRNERDLQSVGCRVSGFRFRALAL